MITTVAIAAVSFGQTPFAPINGLKVEQANQYQDASGKSRALTQFTRSRAEYPAIWTGWKTAWEAFDTTKSTGIYSAYMWPDSTVMRGYSGDGNYYTMADYWGNSYNLFGQVVDFSSKIYDDTYGGGLNIFDSTSVFNIDSIDVGYIYRRNNTSSAADTLRMWFLPEGNNLLRTTFSEGQPFPLFNVNTTGDSIYPVIYDESQITKRDIILTAEDTTDSGFFSYLSQDVDITLGDSIVGQIGAFVFKFIPGHSYSNGDTLVALSGDEPSNKLNLFQLMTVNENVGSDPDSYTNDDPVSYNGMVGVESTWLRTETSLRSRALTITESSQYSAHLLMYTKVGVTTLDVSTEELTVNDFKVYPNPSNGSFTIDVSSLSNAIEIFNMVGKRVYFNATPSFSNNIQLSGVPTGIYVVKVGENTERIILN